MKMKYAISLLFLVCLWGCKQSEESKIKEICSRFIEGRRALLKGDSLKLKLVTEDSLYRLIILNQQYFDILDATKIRADLRISPVSVEIDGDCATCLMSGEEHYKINLCRNNGRWEVKGENGIYPTSERLAAAKKQLADYKDFLKTRPQKYQVIKIVNNFFDGVRVFFKSGKSTLLQETCDNSSADFIERLCAYAKNRTGVALMSQEMEKYNTVMGDISLKGDSAVFRFFREEETFVNLKKTDDSYVIIGFNGIDSENLTNKVMKDNYLALLRAVKLIRVKQYRDKAIK